MPTFAIHESTLSITKLKDIADAAGVSIGTVSRALRGKTKGHWASSAEQVDRILELAKQMNYQPNKAAQVMRTQRTYQIGVISSEFYNPHTSRTLQMLGEELSQRGYGLLLKLIPGDKENFAHEVRIFSRNLIDGVLNHHPLLAGDEAERLIDNIPVVTIDRSPQYSPAIMDMDGATKLGLQHLWDLGHRKIALVAGSKDKPRGRRYTAYKAFYAGKRVKASPDWIFQYGWTYEDGEAAVEPFLATGCTACLAGNDLLAVALCSGIRLKGYEVPRDFSIVSMDDTMLTSINRPQLTSLHPPSRELIQLSVAGLIAKIEGTEPPEFQRIMPTLVVRESTAAPAKA
jgi:DNA-binding LacI/PurR family transcriptional regulator